MDAFKEGRVSFKIPSREEPCETYYKIYGNLSAEKPPLLVLHGGPGAGHEYMEPYSKLWQQFRIPVIFYDQIGCASSTHLQDRRGDDSFWQPELFITELDNLLNHLGLGGEHGLAFDVFGHSWGGILAAIFAAKQPVGLRKLILGGAPSSLEGFRRNVGKLLQRLPPSNLQALEVAVENEDFKDAGYIEGFKLFQQMYTCRADPWPAEYLKNRSNQAQDDTVRYSLIGRSPLVAEGSLKDLTLVPLLPQIRVPTLLFTAEFDTATDEDVMPQFGLIPKVRWAKLEGGSHMPHLDSEELLQKSLQVVGDFLSPEEYGR